MVKANPIFIAYQHINNSDRIYKVIMLSMMIIDTVQYRKMNRVVWS